MWRIDSQRIPVTGSRFLIVDVEASVVTDPSDGYQAFKLRIFLVETAGKAYGILNATFIFVFHKNYTFLGN